MSPGPVTVCPCCGCPCDMYDLGWHLWVVERVSNAKLPYKHFPVAYMPKIPYFLKRA